MPSNLSESTGAESSTFPQKRPQFLPSDTPFHESTRNKRDRYADKTKNWDLNRTLGIELQLILFEEDGLFVTPTKNVYPRQTFTRHRCLAAIRLRGARGRRTDSHRKTLPKSERTCRKSPDVARFEPRRPMIVPFSIASSHLALSGVYPFGGENSK